MVFWFYRWGRGHPEEYTEAIAIGEEKFDADSDKKPRAGQILWIRGLTRLQTQVSAFLLILIMLRGSDVGGKYIQYLLIFSL